MTLFGLFFVSICFIGWFKPVKYLFSVVIFSCVFQAAAVFNVGTSGIPPYIVTVISVWISDGFFSALIAGVVSFFVWGLVVGVADKLGMLPD